MITKILWLLATLLLAHVQLATAQHPAKPQSTRKFTRVGYLSPFIASSRFRAPFRQQLYEHGATSELVISLNAAKQIGLTIPANVLARADRVIK